MLKGPILAKAKVQNLSKEALSSLLKQEMSSAEGLLLQDHYNVAGSYEEHIGDVQTAFRTWRRAEDTLYDYRYSCILSILPGTVVFFTDDYYDDNGTSYYTVSYSTGTDGSITFSGNVTAVDVNIVVSALAGDATQSINSLTEETTMDKKVKQDTVPESHVVTDLALDSTPANHSDSNPKLPMATTDAEVTGVTVPDQLEAAVAATPVEHSDENGAGKGPMPEGEDYIAEEAAKTAAGLKQSEGSGATVFTKDNLLQSICKDSANQSLSYVKLQSVETAADGKKLMHLQGIATRADIVNAGGEVYPLSVWQSNLETMNTEAAAGKFLGKLEHPAQEQGLVDTALKFSKFWLQGSDVWFEAVVVPTDPYGKNLQAMIEAGVSIDLSSRGYGTMKQQDWRGQSRKVIQDDFKCVGMDAVWYGASTGSGVTTATYQSKDKAVETDGKKEEITQAMELTPAQTKAAALQAKVDVENFRKNLIQSSELSEIGNKALQSALSHCHDIESLNTTFESMVPALKETFPAESTEVTQSQTYAPQFYVKQSKEELAPKSVDELFDRMVADLPDTPIGASGPGGFFQSQRKVCKRLLEQTANSAGDGFNGRAAALGLLALEQGNVDRAQNFLTQSLPAGGTIANGNASNDGAPLSAPMIFPLIRRVFPQYIMHEIASVQPMDRPQGKIFYLDAYRTNSNDTVENRIDLNTSANPFNSSYADNSTEGSAAVQIRMRLSSITVSAYTKKIGAAWSIEETQDLRAYHNLDAAQELMGSTAREMALEWNKTVLDDMIGQATGAALTYGTLAPSTGFPNQKDWEEYLWKYITSLDNQIFAQRNGGITHLVCGVDAALAMGASMRFATTSDVDGNMELYPGTTFYGTVNSPAGNKYKIFKTNFWTTGTTNGAKILGLRKGAEWSDTPYIFAPFADFVTPVLTDPADFTQKQGILSRAAKQVVVPNAMGTITVVPGTQGSVI